MRVVLASDFSEHSQLTLAEACTRPWPPSSSFVVLHVVDFQGCSKLPAIREESYSKLQRLGESLKSTTECLARLGHSAGYEVVTGIPRGTIFEYAKSWQADLIMAGSRGKSAIAQFQLGSVVQGILRTAPCSVEIVRWVTKSPPSSHAMKILLATDGSECSLAAAHSLASRPWPDGTIFRILHIDEFAVREGLMTAASLSSIYPTSLLEELIATAADRAERAVAAALGVLEGGGLTAERSKTSPLGEPRGLILQAAQEWMADMIVLGSHGRRGIDKLLIGSVSETVATYAHCSVEVIRPRVVPHEA